MDIFAFAPVAALLDLFYALVEGIAGVLAPISTPLNTALAIVVLTIIVRTALIPVGISQVKAEWARRRIAPKLQALQRKYKGKPEQLQKKSMALYKAENVSPFAGFLPLLLQAPVISLVYALFIRHDINGHANDLLTQDLGGVALGSPIWQAGWPGILVFIGLFAVMALVAWMTRRTTLRLNPVLPDAPANQVTMQRILSWMPFLTIVFAALVPLAATLYLATTTLWTLVERAVLRRRYWGEVGGVPVAV
jgi:YidC/Oxa1 family membrane protein insertase